MSIAAVEPIVRVQVPAAVVTAPTAVASIHGVVARVDRRGKSLFTSEGTGLSKIGRGDVATVTHNGSVYRGELVAIAPSRAILHISNSRADHGVTKA